MIKEVLYVVTASMSVSYEPDLLIKPLNL